MKASSFLRKRVASAHVTRSAALIALLFGADKVLGVIRDAAMSRAFGASAQLDAYYAAFEVPEGLNTIVTGAALTTSLIPVLSSVIARDDPEDVWHFVSSVINWLLIIVGGAGIVAALLARPIITTLAPGFADQPAQVALSVQLMRLVLIQTLVFSLSTLVTGTLQAHQHFLLPALAPLLYTLGRILGATVLAQRWGIFGLAYGGLIGAACHLLIKVPWLIRRRARWRPRLSHPQLLPLFRLMVPRMMGMSATYINFILPTTLGSLLASGAIAAYEYGWRLMQLPETVFGTALGIAVLPTLTAWASRGDKENLVETFSWTLRLVLALTIPAAMGLLLLGRPLIVLFLQRGAFDPATTERVYWGLQFFALGLVGHTALEIVARLFYAQKRMWPPFWAALAGLALNAGLGWLLLPTLAHGSMALSNSLGVWLQVVILLVIARVHLGSLEERELGKSLARTAGATAAMAAAVMGVRLALQDVGVLFEFAAAVGVGLITYLGVAVLLGSQEILSLPRFLLQREAQ